MPLTKKEIQDIDTKIRQVIKSKLKLAKNFPVEPLHVKAFYGLRTLEDALQEDILTKHFGRLQAKTLVGEIARTREAILSHQYNLIRPIFGYSKFEDVNKTHKKNQSTDQRILNMCIEQKITFTEPKQTELENKTPLEDLMGSYEDYSLLTKNNPIRYLEQFTSRSGMQTLTWKEFQERDQWSTKRKTAISHHNPTVDGPC